MKEFSIVHEQNHLNFDDKLHFLDALARWNYFPNQKCSASELPPSISSRRFTPEIIRVLLKNIKITKVRHKLGFDLVEYRATRYNNISRTLGLIHPLAYAQIFEVIERNYEVLKVAMEDSNSAIRAEAHTDGRILIMNYEDHETKIITSTDKSFAKKFRAHTDISNCFASIYTHSLEWATQGFEIAKANLNRKGHENHWSAEFDKVLRGAKRNETSGLPVGPASSSIAVEVILAVVDAKLRERFSFTRYVDDYTALCSSYEEAQEFILVLSNELSQYRLTLNLAKTSIVELPEPLQETWVSELMNGLPAGVFSDSGIAYINTSDAFQFLDHAVRLNNKTPDGSVIKFAVSAISYRVQGRVAENVFQYVLNLAWHYPILLPYLEKIDAKKEYYDREVLVEKLNKIMEVNLLHRRSDGVCWALYYLDRLSANPTDEIIEMIIESKDCVAIMMLCKFRTGLVRAIEFAKALFELTDYAKDQYWILLYQLYAKGQIDDPYTGEPTFEILKKYDVDFMPDSRVESRAEEYCLEKINPFIEKDQIQPFDEWIDGRPVP
jgi:hypothetical protein